IENIFAFSLTSNKSLTIALAPTMPAQPPNACKPRNIINEFTEVAKAQPIDATRYIERPTYIGLFRPNLSSSGPYNNCPAEIPIKKLDRDNITFATLVCRLLA